MRLAHPFVQLPLTFDAERLGAEIAALGENAWRDHPQKFPGNSMLPLVAVDGDPANEGYKGAMRPTAELGRCPYLQQAMAAVGATVGRTRLMRLSGHSEVNKHADQDYYWAERARVHIPIETQPTVRFECGGLEVNMGAGECWIFDTWRMHRVTNGNDEQRIHLVIDTVGGADFWNLVESGRIFPQIEAQARWAPQTVAFDPNARPALRFESSNVPTVMSPWEINTHLTTMFAEVNQHPDIGRVHRAASLFLREWRALWATYADTGQGADEYKRALTTFLEDVKEPASRIYFANRTTLLGGIAATIGLAAWTRDPLMMTVDPGVIDRG